jgi:hypothetical protein
MYRDVNPFRASPLCYFDYMHVLFIILSKLYEHALTLETNPRSCLIVNRFGPHTRLQGFFFRLCRPRSLHTFDLPLEWWSQAHAPRCNTRPGSIRDRGDGTYRKTAPGFASDVKLSRGLA